MLTLVMLALQVAAHLRFQADRDVALSSADVERRLEHVDRLLVDAESGRRGFLLTGKERISSTFQLDDVMCLVAKALAERLAPHPHSPRAVGA